MGFYTANDDLPLGAGFPGNYPLHELRALSHRIIQPAEFIREYSDQSEDSVPFLRAANVEDGSLNLDDIVFVDAAKLNKAADSFIESGDILITRTGAKAGATCVVPKLSRKFCISSHSIRLIPRRDIIIPEFLEAFLLSRWGKAQIERLFTGAAQKQLQLASVGQLQIAVPPINFQRALAAKMQAAREVHNEKLRRADALLASLDVYLLDALGLTRPQEDSRVIFAVQAGSARKRFDPHFHLPSFQNILRTLAGTQTRRLGAVGHFSHETWDRSAETSAMFRYIEISGVNLATGEASFSHVPVTEAPSRAQMVVRAGDILISLTRPHRGAIAQIGARSLRAASHPPVSPFFAASLKM